MNIFSKLFNIKKQRNYDYDPKEVKEIFIRASSCELL